MALLCEGKQNFGIPIHCNSALHTTTLNEMANAVELENTESLGLKLVRIIACRALDFSLLHSPPSSSVASSDSLRLSSPIYHLMGQQRWSWKKKLNFKEEFLNCVNACVCQFLSHLILSVSRIQQKVIYLHKLMIILETWKIKYREICFSWVDVVVCFIWPRTTRLKDMMLLIYGSWCCMWRNDGRLEYIKSQFQSSTGRSSWHFAISIQLHLHHHVTHCACKFNFWVLRIAPKPHMPHGKCIEFLQFKIHENFIPQISPTAVQHGEIWERESPANFVVGLHASRRREEGVSKLEQSGWRAIKLDLHCSLTLPYSLRKRERMASLHKAKREVVILYGRIIAFCNSRKLALCVFKCNFYIR